MKSVFVLSFLLIAGNAFSQVPTMPPIPPPIPDPNALPPPVMPASNIQMEQQVIFEPAPPVRINGKPATQLTDDEIREFLEEKILTFYQSPGQVEILKVAPGYALTMTFDLPVGTVVMGDRTLVSANTQGRTLILSAAQRSGDTDMQIIFGGGRIFNYHIFIAPNFVSAQTTIRVVSTDQGDGNTYGSGSPYGSSGADLDIGGIAYVIANYDALALNKAVDTRTVKRIPVFKKSEITSFEVYYIYTFQNGPAAITFAYTNPFEQSIRYDESRLRLQIGDVRYTPDFVSMHHPIIGPGETTTGFAIIAQPRFKWNQPFEIVWE